MKPLLAASILVILASACRREDTRPHQPALNTWEVEDSVYRKAMTLWTDGLSYTTDTVVHFFDRDTSMMGNSVSFTFGDTPKAGSDYRVVGGAERADSAGEVSISVRQLSGTDVYSDVDLGGTLQVRSINGKLIFIATNVQLEYTGFFGAHAYSCSFNLIE